MVVVRNVAVQSIFLMGSVIKCRISSDLIVLSFYMLNDENAVHSIPFHVVSAVTCVSNKINNSLCRISCLENREYGRGDPLD
jgi:hypothetical protein